MRTAVAVGFAILTAGFSSACGDDDGNGAPSSSGVAGDTLLAELTDAQLQALCRFGERTYKASLSSEDAFCAAAGADGAASIADCEDWKQACLDEGEFESEVNEDWECAEETADSEREANEGCTATVADLEACIKARAREDRDWAETASCDDPTSFEGPDLAPECDVFGEDCAIGF